MSKYDDIKTAKELVYEVQMHGLSTDQADLNRAADIFGHSAIRDLACLANDIGLNNEDGEPDPNGTWGTGHKPTRNTFYSIASRVWNWEELVNFWNRTSNPEHDEVIELRATCNSLRENIVDRDRRIHEAYARIEAKDKALTDISAAISEATDDNECLKKKIHDKELEILKLKARLYDLLAEKAED